MKLSTIYNALIQGELSQHAIGNQGTVSVDNYRTLAGHTQIALRELCTRFPLIEKTIKIRMIEGQTDYLLDPKHADSVGNAEPKWIVDTAADPFMVDQLRFDSAVDNEGLPLSINDPEDDTAISNPVYNIIRIPSPVADEFVTVTYRADHMDIGEANDPEAVEIGIPLSLFECLLSYIGARVYSSMGTEIGNAKSGFYFGKYNAKAAEIEAKNILNSALNATNTKLEQRGFV
jgi:hypothetical protein